MARNLEMRFPFKVNRASPRGAWDAGLGGSKPLIIALLNPVVTSIIVVTIVFGFSNFLSYVYFLLVCIT